MALPESSLSIVCNAIFGFVRDPVRGLDAVGNSIDVTIGAPADVPDGDRHRLNLFFYRFEQGGFEAGAHPNDPWRVRIYCMVTAFSYDDSADVGGASAGENALRLIGEVMRVFREAPVMDAITVDSEEVRLQAVFTPATDEQINQIWSTQGDTSYHPSVVYEMALAPIMPSTLRVHPSLVGAVGQQARADESGRHAIFSGAVQGPPVSQVTVDTSNPQWPPQLCWIYDGECAYCLSIDEAEAFTAQIWLAGDTGDSVDLVWEIWDSAGWRSAGAAVPAAPFSTEIDPDSVPIGGVGFPLVVANPVSIPGVETAAQGVLYATRQVTLIPGEPAIEVRSNPLLLSIYRT